MNKVTLPYFNTIDYPQILTSHHMGSPHDWQFVAILDESELGAGKGAAGAGLFYFWAGSF